MVGWWVIVGKTLPSLASHKVQWGRPDVLLLSHSRGVNSQILFFLYKYRLLLINKFSIRKRKILKRKRTEEMKLSFTCWSYYIVSHFFWQISIHYFFESARIGVFRTECWDWTQISSIQSKCFIYYAIYLAPSTHFHQQCTQVPPSHHLCHPFIWFF